MKEDYENMPNGYHDGWSSWNPHKTVCLECGSTNVEFFWDNGDPVGFHCIDCGCQEGSKA